ncbi:hypothetical protein P168DRAFT_291923 [Aspergillus campestris IBT 28561]|uniref:Uncharacterized protein n=1 Tax=Aspergillus campestris (strain IBT 28561) TaxID=1392248 RepID=A0A2I1CYV6_ASPC2|nr:uncharacterized protein P168DRAFT_291923 [Aspergillus campestris IBT 28561]PKY02804.1 hypothetical protein P168DRAFT_291923 [Aspergillus campestris IBT 28561]
MSKKMIFLMGAPTVQSLHWDETELLNEPTFPFENEGHRPSSDTQPVKWRLLPKRGALEENLYGAGVTQFLTTRDLTNREGDNPDGSIPSELPEDSMLSQFYNHSFTVHETSTVSAPGSMEESDLWAGSTATSIATSNEGDKEAPGPMPPIQGPVIDLQDIPSARYLESIVPQTMTVNLIVSIITIHPPRRIVTRQWKKELDLVEMVVGDETRSGFGVTLWLGPVDQTKGGVAARGCAEGGDLGPTLAGLRPRDIVLLRMVGLSSFRERVYGQSLRKGVTKVDLLHRPRVDAGDAGGLYSARQLRDVPQTHPAAKKDDLPLAKVSKVREWIRRFVGSSPDAAGGERTGVTNPKLVLPPDTPDTYN